MRFIEVHDLEGEVFLVNIAKIIWMKDVVFDPPHTEMVLDSGTVWCKETTYQVQTKIRG